MSFSGRIREEGREPEDGSSSAVSAAIEGQSPSVGLVGSKLGVVSDRPVIMMQCPLEWSFDAWLRDRQRAQDSLRFASSGRCSQIWSPGVFVAMGRNSPRISLGESGFRSKLSSCESPPERKM